MIDLKIHTQPDDETCGPTSLHAIYHYYGLNLSLQRVVEEVERSLSGGTLAPFLGAHALKHGFKTTIYINNLNLFDPSWFDEDEDGEVQQKFLYSKLQTQMRHKRTKGLLHESQAYLDYLSLGGEIRFKTLSVKLLKRYFSSQIPILTSLSATYLYRCPRSVYTSQGEEIFDDIRGKPCGHFVVLCGYDAKRRLIVVADPHRENPISQDNYYKVGINRLINAIMLGVLTYDANLLIIEPKDKEQKQ